MKEDEFLEEVKAAIKSLFKDVIKSLVADIKDHIDWTQLSFEEEENVQTDIDIAEQLLKRFK